VDELVGTVVPLLRYDTHKWVGADVKGYAEPPSFGRGIRTLCSWLDSVDVQGMPNVQSVG
jgi:hypothetical protein